MNIPKAIENRTACLKNGEIPKSSDDYNATLLSIEALQRVLLHRKDHHSSYPTLLPSETKEQCKYCGLAHTAFHCPSREGEK